MAVVNMAEFTHLDNEGKASMVDVGDKAVTVRTARAQAVVRMKPETIEMIKGNALKKGDCLSCARIAGIMAAKKTSELIPLCHQIPIEKVSVDFEFEENALRIETFARCEYKTGIEMETMTAASVAALTVYDMCKAVDRGMEIDEVRLLHKDGGRSGEYNYEG